MHGPNLENQRIIAETGIFDLCDRIFGRLKLEHQDDKEEGKTHVYTDEHGHQNSYQVSKLVERNQMRNKLRRAALSCLDGFLEAVEDIQIINQFLVQLNWDGVVSSAKDCYDLYHAGIGHRDFAIEPEEALQEGLNFFFILSHMRPYDYKKEYVVPALEGLSPLVVSFFEAHTGNVEIVRQERLERCYFQIPSTCLKGGPLDTPKIDIKIYDADRSIEKKSVEFVENLCALVQQEQFREEIRQTSLRFTVDKVFFFQG